MSDFEVFIPERNVPLVREKLAKEQRHKAAQDQVRYSQLRNTFWKWTRTPRGWTQQKCSRNGKRVGEFFNGFKREVAFKKLPDGRSAYRINPHRERPTLDIPGFLPLLNYVGATTGPRWSSVAAEQADCLRPRMISPKIRLSYPSLEKTPMSPLKLSILFWRAAHPTEVYSAPPDTGFGVSLAAKADLVRDGLIEICAAGGYRLTDKGTVYVAHLIAQPLPVASKPKWEIPATAA